jgi:GH15 family glucan-1,4-alpha-glucosidase
LEKALRVQTPIGGYARYQRDFYHSKVPPTETVPGNPWIITTLWLAQWQIARAKTTADLAAARALLDWVVERATGTGMLAEQLHPLTGEPLSVAPLTWSHATYVETILLLLQKERQLVL